MVDEPIVELHDVVALLGRFPALSGVDLRVHGGEIVLVQGPNGAGKTSLLRVCAALLPIERGVGRIDGHDLTSSRAAVRRSVGYLGHESGLYDELTVRDNVRFWTRANGVAAADADAAMVDLGLHDRLAGIAVARLSAGQRRRVALAVLLARRPRVWLLDEPHATLDEQARDLLDTLVRRAAAGGAAVVVASHDLDRAAALAHRSVVLAGGHIVAPATDETPSRVTLEAVDG